MNTKTTKPPTTPTPQPSSTPSQPTGQSKGDELLMKLVRSRVLPIVQEPDPSTSNDSAAEASTPE